MLGSLSDTLAQLDDYSDSIEVLEALISDGVLTEERARLSMSLDKISSESEKD